jgi:hypothetical protein
MEFNNRRILIFVLGLMLSIACSSNQGSKGNADDFEPGKVIPRVICKNEVNYSYALYLPKSYSKENKYPVVFAFDAHAKGSKPVELFSEMAEKYGYILVGSNNSQNGVKSEESLHIYDVLYNDVMTRLSVDDKRLYTAGFSGGSRVASSVAIFKGGITAVIGCSAGFPSLKEGIKQKFDFIGFVGDEDMNYLEMARLDKDLQQAGYRHQLVVFKGKHDWPTKEVIQDAFIFTEANAMKDLKKPVDKEFISSVAGVWESKAAELEKGGKKYEAYMQYKKIMNFFGGLTDTAVIGKKASALAATGEVKVKIAKEDAGEKKEFDLQNQYVAALTSQNTAWWKAEVKHLNDFASSSKDENESALIRRVLSYMSLIAYSNANGYLNAGQIENAARYNELYSIIDPTNNEHAYISAVIDVKQGNNDKAFESLNKALELGYNDVSRFQNDTVLARLKNEQRYFDFLEKLKKQK